MFPRNFPEVGEAADLLRIWRANKSATSWQQVVVMEFGKRQDTTQQTRRTFARASCYGLSMGKLTFTDLLYNLLCSLFVAKININEQTNCVEIGIFSVSVQT